MGPMAGQAEGLAWPLLFSKPDKVREKQAPWDRLSQAVVSTLPPGRGLLINPGCWGWDSRISWIWVLAQPPIGGMTLGMTVHLCVPQPSHP